MAVIGRDPVPTAFDAVSSTECSAAEPVSAIRVKLSQCDPNVRDGCRTGTPYESQVAVIPFPEPRNNFTLPLDEFPVPPVDAGLPEGRYLHQMTVIAESGAEVEVRGLFVVHLVYDPNSLQAELWRHQGRWRRTGFAMDYTYTGLWFCSCPPEYTAVVQVSVRGGRIADVTPENPEVGAVPEPDRYLVENVFGLLQDAITSNADRISMEYDERFGYPRTFLVSYDYTKAGDEVGGALRNLTPLPF